MQLLESLNRVAPRAFGDRPRSGDQSCHRSSKLGGFVRSEKSGGASAAVAARTQAIASRLARIVAFLLCFGFASQSHAGTSITGKIVLIDMSKDYGNFVFVKLDVNPSAPIACHTNLAWTYTLPLVTDMDKRMHAALLLAYATGRSVTLRGSGTCTDFSSIESAVSVRLESQ
jgi:hypothetical protein